jgi:hypothetical protein
VVAGGGTRLLLSAPSLNTAQLHTAKTRRSSKPRLALTLAEEIATKKFLVLNQDNIFNKQQKK